MYISPLDKIARYVNCPTCEEERKAEEQRKTEEFRKKLRETARKKLRERCGIPPRFENKTLETLEFKTPKQKTILKAVRNYLTALLTGTRASLVMCGKPGTGKTHIGCALVSAMVENVKAARIITTANLMRSVKATYRQDAEDTEEDVLERYGNLWLLVIDEVGVQFGTETEKLIFYEIVNRRYENMLPTVLISNLTAEELSAFIGERAFDRFREDGGAILAFDWESYRR